MRTDSGASVTRPQRFASAFSSPSWSSTRATMKSIRSSTLLGAVVEARREGEDRRAGAAAASACSRGGSPRAASRAGRGRASAPPSARRTAARWIRFWLSRRGDRTERPRRARADDVGVDRRRAGGVRRAPVVRVVDGDRAAASPSASRVETSSRESSASPKSSSRAPRIAAPETQTPDLAAGGGERLEQAFRVGRA